MPEMKKRKGLINGGGSEGSGDGADEEVETEEGGGGNKMLKLPYALAKEQGLSTDGMRPRQVWDLLEGKGVNKDDEEQKFLEKQKNDLTNSGNSGIINQTKTLSDELYSDVSNLYSLTELKAAFKRVVASPIGKEAAGHIMDCVDGKLFTTADLKNLDVSAVALSSYGKYSYDPNNMDNCKIRFDSLSAFPTDKDIARIRSEYGKDYCDIADYRVPENQRLRMNAHHETAHYIDHKFSLDPKIMERPSGAIYKALKARGITDNDIKNDISDYAAYNAKELFAEGFACIKNIKKADFTPTMAAFAEEFDKYFGGKI